MNVIGDTLAAAQAPCLTSSFPAECVVLNHMLREQRPGIPVLFLETHHHFAQTLAYRDALAAAWGLNLINVQAPAPRPGLWRTESTQACCAHPKVGPLFSALLHQHRLRAVHDAAHRSGQSALRALAGREARMRNYVQAK
jgi:phosphoadenosine phosphosulfate reductase